MKRFIALALALILSAAFITAAAATAQADFTASAKGENTPPTAEDMVVQTYKNTPRTLPFDAEDADGDALEFALVSPPSKGEVTLGADGTFTYTPAEGKSGRDTFVYTAADPSGAVSREALVTVDIGRKAPKVEYSDTAGTGVEYEAARLAQEGIFVGEQINGLYCFSPEKTVSRGEFLAMTVNAAGIETLDVLSAGFDDDAETAAWQTGYIAAAREAGVIGGIELDGLRLFQSARPITGKEACRVVTGLMGFEAQGMIETAAGEEAWAVTAVMAAEQNDFSARDAFSGGDITRADAAKIIVSMLEHQ